MKNSMMSVAEASTLIESGAICVLAGSHEALAQLPKGKWIGGTSVYFMTDKGGVVDLENVFVTEIDEATDGRCVLYEGEDLPNLAMGRFKGGMDMIILPGFSRSHEDYAINCQAYPGLFEAPVMGWIAGTHLTQIGHRKPAVFDGATGAMFEDGAMVMHVELPEGKVSDVDIVNLFEQDLEGDEIVFPETGFSATTARVNGKEVDFASYLTERKIDTQRPLVANAAGAMVNVSFQAVEADKVVFYAPVVAGVPYRHAKAVGDYAETFAREVGQDGAGSLSCNCILNFVYGALEGKTTGNITGPATFGEVAYILLNQTLVRLDVTTAVGTGAQVA